MGRPAELFGPDSSSHHAVSWEAGGATSADNGHLLCRRHHSFRHRHRDWTSTFDDQRFRAFRPDGREVSRDPWPDMTWAA